MLATNPAAAHEFRQNRLVFHKVKNDMGVLHRRIKLSITLTSQFSIASVRPGYVPRNIVFSMMLSEPVVSPTTRKA